MGGRVDLEDPIPALLHLAQATAGSELALLVRFDARNEPVTVAASSALAAAGFRAGTFAPALREALRHAQITREPWFGTWTRPGTAYGPVALPAAYLPINDAGRSVGLIVVPVDGPLAAGLAALTACRPVLVALAELAGPLLGPEFDRLDERAAAAVRLERILASDAFSPVFQPICDLETRAVVGLEALTRFDQTTPDAAFAEAALLGRLHELEVATLTKALKAAEQLPPDRWLSVNVSPALLADTAILRQLLGRSLRPIVLELSEHELVHDYGVLTRSLRRMEPFVSLAIDDAGAGFSSLRHILETSPAWVKLDIGLVRGVDRDPARQALVAGLVQFAQRTGTSLIAEGIETEIEDRMLQSLGVKLGQGFFLARPAPIDNELIRSLLRAPA